MQSNGSSLFIRRSSASLKRGSALLAVILFSAVMLFVAAASLGTIKFQTGQAARSLAYKQAMALAEAGAERALAELNTSTNQWSGWTASGTTRQLMNQAVSDSSGRVAGQFSVSVLNASAQTATIESAGTVASVGGPPVVRRIRVPARGNTTPSQFGPYGIQSTDFVMVNSNSSNDAYNSNNGPYGQNGNAGLPSTVAAATYVTLNSNASVGNVQAGGTITKGSNVTHGNLVAGSVPTAPPQFPDAELSAAKQANSNHLMKIYKVTGQNKTLIQTGIPSSGVFNFNNLNAQRLRIEMPAGNYFLTSLQINSNADIVSEGPVKLYLDPGSQGSSAILMSSNTSINAEGENPLPKNFQIFVKNGTVTFNSQYTMYAGLFAPNANLAIFNSNTHFFGVVVAKGITLNSNSHVHVDMSMAQPAGNAGYLAQCWTEISRGS